MKKRTQKCSLCGENMVEDGDGWCSGDQFSKPGFYSAHWKCRMEDPSGNFVVLVNGREYGRYNNRQASFDRINYLADNNYPGSRYEVLEFGEVIHTLTGRLERRA